jgi:cytochrome c oxidase subunit IV
MEDHHDNHVTSYAQNFKILFVLLLLTISTILVIKLDLGPYTVAMALFLASVKTTIVLTYFMHLKGEKLILRLMVGGVFLLFAIIVIITFIDYYFRII